MRRTAIAAACATSLLVCCASAQAVQPIFYQSTISPLSSPVKIEATLGATFLAAANGTKVECQKGAAAGEVTGTTKVQFLTMRLIGCTSGGNNCENAAAGEIVTSVLEGALGNPKVNLPGLRLYNEATGPSGLVAAFTCAAATIAVRVKGGAIGTLSGAAGEYVSNQLLNPKIPTSFKLTYQETAGKQKYTEFLPGEGPPGSEQFEWEYAAGPLERTGLSSVMTIKSNPTAQLGFTK
jgi:hypothetical protein